METVRLLDSYRLAVTREPAAVLFLALLHRDGPQSDSALAQATRRPIHSARKSLTELFRANLVTMLEDGRYANAELAEQVLASLGVTDIAAKDTVASAALPEQDKAFLLAYFVDRERDPAEWRRYVSAAVKCTSAIIEDAALRPSDATRLWYAVVSGLDPASHELGPEISCRRIMSHADLNSNNVLLDFRHYAQQCDTAWRDRLASNNFMTTGEQGDSREESLVTLAVTFIRLFAAATVQYADDGVFAATTTTTGIDAKARKALRQWSAPFASKYQRRLRDRLRLAVNWNPEIEFVDALCHAPSSPARRFLVSAGDLNFASREESVAESLKVVESRLKRGTVPPQERDAARIIIGRILKLLARNPNADK
jgi:hypothetical protein